jgi:hypothetical protein
VIECGLAISLGLSAHMFTEHEYNNVHPHIRYSCDDYIAGAYYNSLEKPSLYVGKNFKINENLNLDTALVSGYYNKIDLAFRLNYKNFFILPAPENNNIGIVIGFEIPLTK